MLSPTLREWRGAASAPPSGCRTLKSADRTKADDTYECVFCDANPPALREGVVYLINGDCTFEPRPGRITLSAPVIVTEGVTLRPLDVQQPVDVVGQLLVRGNGVTIQDVFVSQPIDVAGSAVTDLRIHNVTATDSYSVLTAGPSNVHHDINLTGLRVSEVHSIRADDDDAGSPDSTLRPIATFFHTYGNTEVLCGDDQLVIVQPMIPQGKAQFPNCDIINFTAILDAYGNAFTYDMYGTPVPEWVSTMRSWAITLTAASAGLILLSRNPSAPPADPAPTPKPVTTGWV